MMENSAVVIDDQPVSSRFFGEGNWLTDFITPDEPDILMLWHQLTEGKTSRIDRAIAAWDWVARQVKYKNFIGATINVEGRVSRSNDFWQSPAMCSKTHIGNCANKAFLLTSLLRNELSENEVHCVLGNLHNGHASGHAWVELNLDGVNYIMEATRDDVPLIDISKAARYEAVHYVNDKGVMAVPGRTVMTPFSACYSKWLGEYLNWAYINGGR